VKAKGSRLSKGMPIEGGEIKGRPGVVKHVPEKVDQKSGGFPDPIEFFIFFQKAPLSGSNSSIFFKKLQFPGRILQIFSKFVVFQKNSQNFRKILRIFSKFVIF
jgi:hypothetical protein